MGLELSGQIALVTGGSRGIGRSVSVALARAGAKVLVNYTANPAAAEETVQLCQQAGGSAVAIQFDVANSTSVDAAFDQIKAKEGKIDILVNNAGISKDGLFIRMKDEDWRTTLSVNLEGAFFCARAAAKLMMKSRYGRIINMTSVVGEMGNAGQVPYVSSKAGLIGLTKAMARELASRSITVNAVAPGFIDTDMTKALPEATREEHLKSIPLERYGTTDEVAHAVLFLVSPGAGYVTGQVLGVNGGMYM